MVEDELLILQLMAEVLYDAGYDVMQVQDGKAAMRAIRERPEGFSALFSDFNLPGEMNGADIATLMRAANPDIPVVLCSGRPDLLEGNPMLARDFVLLRKPYGPAEVIEAMGSVLPPHRTPAP